MKKAFCSALIVCACTCCAQTNSWTNSVGGNWHDAHWSLGVLPADGQTILFTNAGSKSLVIGPDTAQNFPATLRVNSIAVSSVSGSTNTLLISNVVSTYERLAEAITIASNSAVEMNGSWLRTYDVSIGGNFNQSDSHLITHFLRIGDVGPGTFNLSNGVITIVPGYGTYIGGNFPGVFKQYGGTNYGDIILLPSGRYEFFGGTIARHSDAPAIVSFGGEFIQFGGSITSRIRFLKPGGSYRLLDGVLSHENLCIPDSSAGWGSAQGNGFQQSGGTNLGRDVILGNAGGAASMELSGGVLTASRVAVLACRGLNPGSGYVGSRFSQSGGYQTNTELSVEGGFDFFGAGGIQPSYYRLAGGFLSTLSIGLSTGDFTQSGGTNIVGALRLYDVSHYWLSAGRLETESIFASGRWNSHITRFEQTGGVNQTSNIFVFEYANYDLSGGQLFAQNLYVSQASFNHTGGTAQVLKILTLEAGTWNEQSGGQQFGALRLSAQQWIGSNSFLRLPSFPSLIQFGDCSGLLWSNDASLTIEQWSGSLHGNGQHRILFGHGTGALTVQQLAQIRFHDPAGLSPGDYPARILPTGEIVPESGALLPVIVRIARSATNELAVGVGG
ncbi:MAG TPA: hypothetical protein VFZ59_09720, partial [Verrucomicrobiae bacterium]|nr:hypothetical protein [Verrucomicrobiae bacterium]